MAVVMGSVARAFYDGTQQRVQVPDEFLIVNIIGVLDAVKKIITNVVQEFNNAFDDSACLRYLLARIVLC